MNKLFTKIATVCVGLTMAIGVGVAAGVSGVGEAKAEDKTVSWTATAANNLGNKISAAGGTDTGTISTGDFTWNYTRTLVLLASGKSDNISFQGDTWIQMGSNNAMESIELSTSEIPGTIKSVTVVAASAGSHKLTIDVGGTKYLEDESLKLYSGTAAAANPDPADADCIKTGTGSSSGAITITLADSGTTRKAFLLRSISVTYDESGTPAPSTYSVSYHANATVNVDGAVPSAHTGLADGTTQPLSEEHPSRWGYTFSGWSLTPDGTSAVTSVTVSGANVTVYAIWQADLTVKGAHAKNPYTVAEAKTAIDAGSHLAENYVTGKISQIDSYNSTYKSITYWISDDASTSNQLQVYSGKGINGADFSAVTDVVLKASVVVCGTLKKYNDTYEFDKTSSQISYELPEEPILTLDPISVELAKGGASVEVGATFNKFSATPTVTVDGTPAYVTVSINGSTITVSPKDVGKEDVTLKATYGSEVATAKLAVAVYAAHGHLKTDPYTVAEATAALAAGNVEEKVYVSGKVSQVDSFNSTYKSITYWISDDGETEGQFEVYSGKGLNGADFSKKEDVEVGAEVVVYGNIKVYNEVNEFDKNNELASYKAPSAPEVVIIHFMDGEEDKPQECTIGQTIKIPSATSVAPEGYAFDHWVCKEDDKSYKPGDDYTVTGEAHFTIVNHQTAWTKEQSDSFKAVLDGVVPPFISPELVSFTFKEADHAAYAMSTTDYSEAFWSALSTWSDDTYQSVSAKSIETANGKVYASVVKSATFIYGFHFVENTPAPTDWDETTKGLMSEQLNGFVPPYFGEPAYAPTILENFVGFYLEGDRTEDVQKYFVDEKWVEDGTAYRLDVEGGYLIGSFNYDEEETAVMFSFTAVTPIDPTATDWTDGQKAAFAEKLDEVVPPFLGAEFSSMAYDASEGAFKAVAEGDFKAAIKAIFEKEENKDWDLSYYDGYNQAALETEYGYVVAEVDVSEGYTTVYIFFEQTEWYPEELEQFKFAERLDGVVIPYDYYVSNMSWNEEAGCYAFSYIGDYKAKFVSYFEKYFKAYPGEEDVYYVETEHGTIYGQVYNQTYQGKVGTVAMIYYVETLLPTTLVVDTTNAKTEYKVGEELDTSGVVVTLLDQHGNPYFDGNPDLSSYCSFEADLSKSGKVTVTVKFDYENGGENIHLVSSYEINVSAPTSVDFAKAVLAQKDKICKGYDNVKNNSKALTAAWAELSLLYSQIEDETERGIIISAKGDVKGSELEQAMAFYDYVCKKYGLNAFVKGRSSKALVTEKVSETSIVPIIAIVVASVTAVTVIGVIVACKRRKNYLLK